MEAIRQMLAMCMVLGLLGGALWWLRRKGVAQFSRHGQSKSERKLLLVERLPLSPGHSLHLVSVGERMLLVASSPGGCALLQVSEGGRVMQGQESAR
jgi:flagellar biogenesis protein FliO